MGIGNVEMRGKWEGEVGKIEGGEGSGEGLRDSMEGYRGEMSGELLGCERVLREKDWGWECGKWKEGRMELLGKVVRWRKKEWGM